MNSTVLHTINTHKPTAPSFVTKCTSQVMCMQFHVSYLYYTCISSATTTKLPSQTNKDDIFLTCISD